MIIVAAAAATATIVVFLAATMLEAAASFTLLYPTAYFVLAVIHTGSRVDRKT